MSKPKLVVIVGPTAVGKTKVALTLAERLGGEIISADSMQVYKGMDIGTAKPTLEDQGRIEHHLISIIEPSQAFSVAQYQAMARSAIATVQKKGKLPLLVGGSGLYVRAVVDDFFFPLDAKSDSLRNHLQMLASQRSLYEELKRLDPRAADKIDPRNTRRVIRALEVTLLTNTPFSQFQTGWGKSIYNLKMYGLKAPREKLYARIEERIDDMLKQGLLEEVQTLISRGIPGSSTALQAIGYRQMVEYLQGARSWEETVGLIKKKSRWFAKRQLTWFRADSRIKWVDIDAVEPVSFIEKDLRMEKFV